MRRTWTLVVMLLSAAACGGAKSDRPPDAKKDAAPPDPGDDGEPQPEPESKAPPLPEPKLLEPIGEPIPAPAQQVVVALPPPPSLAAPSVPTHHPDGAWSVAGLREDRDARMAEGEAGTEIEVRAYIQTIYVPPECPEGEVCPPGKQPHVWVTDDPDERGRERAMLVVNYAFAIPEWERKLWEDQPDVVLEKGRQYTFKGKFRRFSDTGFAHDSGLLEFVAYRPIDPDTGHELPTWVYPPGAMWHPITIAEQERQNAELAERAGR